MRESETFAEVLARCANRLLLIVPNNKFKLWHTRLDQTHATLVVLQTDRAERHVAIDDLTWELSSVLNEQVLMEYVLRLAREMWPRNNTLMSMSTGTERFVDGSGYHSEGGELIEEPPRAIRIE